MSRAPLDFVCKVMSGLIFRTYSIARSMNFPVPAAITDPSCTICACMTCKGDADRSIYARTATG